MPDASTRSPLNSLEPKYHHDSGTPEVEAGSHPLSPIPDGPTHVTAHLIESQLLHDSTTRQIEAESHSPIPSLDAVSTPSPLSPPLVGSTPSTINPTEPELHYDSEMPRAAAGSHSPVSPIPAEPTHAAANSAQPKSYHEPSMLEASQAKDEQLHQYDRCIADTESPAKHTVSVPLSPRRAAETLCESGRRPSTPSTSPTDLQHRILGSLNDHDRAMEPRNTETVSLRPSAATELMHGTAHNHGASNGQPHPPNLSRRPSSPNESNERDVNNVTSTTLKHILPQAFQERQNETAADDSMIETIEVCQQILGNRPRRSSLITSKGRSAPHPVPISSTGAVPCDASAYIYHGHSLSVVSTLTVSGEAALEDASRQTDKPSPTAEERIEHTPSASSSQKACNRTGPLRVSELLNSPSPELPLESTTTCEPPYAYRRPSKVNPTPPLTPSSLMSSEIPIYLTDRWYPPPVTYSDSERVQTDLPPEVLESHMRTFNMTARVSITPGPVGNCPDVSTQPKFFAIRAIMCCPVRAFYEWYSQVSSSRNGLLLRFELSDLTCQNENGFIISEDQPDSFGLLKQYIWDMFWTESHLRGALEVFTITVEPYLPSLNYLPHHENQTPRTPISPPTTSQTRPVRSANEPKPPPPLPDTKLPNELAHQAFTTAFKNHTNELNQRVSLVSLTPPPVLEKPASGLRAPMPRKKTSDTFLKNMIESFAEEKSMVEILKSALIAYRMKTAAVSGPRSLAALWSGIAGQGNPQHTLITRHDRERFSRAFYQELKNLGWSGGRVVPRIRVRMEVKLNCSGDQGAWKAAQFQASRSNIWTQLVDRTAPLLYLSPQVSLSAVCQTTTAVENLTWAERKIFIEGIERRLRDSQDSALWTLRAASSLYNAIMNSSVPSHAVTIERIDNLKLLDFATIVSLAEPPARLLLPS